jgi:hypothetical protein
VKRGLGCSLVLALTCAATAVGLAQAAPPRELWNAFPLDQRTTTPALPATPPTAAPTIVAPPAEGPPTKAPQEEFPWLVALGALVGVAGLSSGLIVVGRRHRARTATLTKVDPEVAEDAAYAAYVASLVGPVAPSDTAHRPPGPRVRRKRPTTAEGELALLAAEYLELVAGGSPRPVADLAARREWSPGKTQKALARARADGILTRPGRGRAGGELTNEGLRILSGLSPSDRSPVVPRGTTPPATTEPHLRLAPPSDPPASEPETPGPKAGPTHDRVRDRRLSG